MDKSFTTKPKNPLVATGIQMTTGIFLSGGGQIYNGQYLKALGFCSMHIASSGYAVEVDGNVGTIFLSYDLYFCYS